MGLVGEARSGGMVGERRLRPAPARTPSGSGATANSGAAAGRHGPRTSAAGCAGSCPCRGHLRRPSARRRWPAPSRRAPAPARVFPRSPAASNGSQRPRIAASGMSLTRGQAQGQSLSPSKCAIAADARTPPAARSGRPRSAAGWSPPQRERPARRRMISTQPSGTACCVDPVAGRAAAGQRPDAS